jgi:4-hydroxy-2-oxoheptanedioate aldolase
MSETPRLNGVIAALEQNKPAFVSFCAAEISVAQALNAAPYDGVVFEMEHRPYDIRALRDCLQYMLDRRQILRRASLAPAVTPFVRIPPNGGETSHMSAPSKRRAMRSRPAGIRGRVRLSITSPRDSAATHLPRLHGIGD